MYFIAVFSTDDGRLTEGRVYHGGFVWMQGNIPALRIVVHDDKGEWMTFNPKAFEPMSDH